MLELCDAEEPAGAVEFDIGVTSPPRLCAMSCEVDDGAAAADTFTVRCGAYTVAFPNSGVGVDVLFGFSAAAARDPDGACAVEFNAGVKSPPRLCAVSCEVDDATGAAGTFPVACGAWTVTFANFGVDADTSLELSAAAAARDPDASCAVRFDAGVDGLLELCALGKPDDTVSGLVRLCAVWFDACGNALLEL